MVFVKKEESLSFPILQMFGLHEKRGDVGIEIEMEGKRLVRDGDTLPRGWAEHVDHSLRGQENAEYVLRNPVPFGDVAGTVNNLFTALESNSAVIDDSNRTSVHIHLNCQKFLLSRVASFLMLYYALEEILVEWCGEQRVGNLFCLRGVDAPETVTAVAEFIRTGRTHSIRDNHHYSGMNPQALLKFGSIEFRTLKGVTTAQPILDWVGVLQRLHELSGEYSDPREVCTLFSQAGPLVFAREVLGKYANLFIPQSEEGERWAEEAVMRGIRLGQEIAYARDWNAFKGGEVKKDPFGRKARDVANRLMSLNSPHVPSIPSSPYQSFLQAMTGAADEELGADQF